MHLTAFRRRTTSFTITLKDANGDNITFAANDVFRVKIGVPGKVPLLDLDSASATSNNSSLTAANPTTMRLDRADLVFDPGTYQIEASIVDNSDEADIKAAVPGVFSLHETQLGDVGQT